MCLAAYNPLAAIAILSLCLFAIKRCRKVTWARSNHWIRGFNWKKRPGTAP
jgi:hypothetical protein